MYGYKRPYSSKWGRVYSYSRPYKFGRRGTVGRALAGAAAAKRSNKQETFSCTVNGVCNLVLPANDRLSNVQTFNPFAGGLLTNGVVNDDNNLCHGAAVNDKQFRMKCACYDEMKLDSMKVTITPAVIGQNNQITFTLCTMWDRKATPKECGFVGDQQWMQNGAAPSAAEIYNNEGTIKSQMTQNSIYGFKRQIIASSMQEKTGFADSSILYDNTETQSPLRIMYMDSWMRNPLAFAPALYLMVYSPAAVTVPINIPFSYKVEYAFTFRNPKSDLDWYCLVESPGYVNPDMPQGLATTRYAGDALRKEIIANYEMRKGKTWMTAAASAEPSKTESTKTTTELPITRTQKKETVTETETEKQNDPFADITKKTAKEEEKEEEEEEKML